MRLVSYKWKPSDDIIDPSYGPKTTSTLPRRPSNLRPVQYPPPNGGGYRYCTASCLKALRANSFHGGCPNAADHRTAPANVVTAIQDIKEALRHADIELLGGGRSGICVSVRTQSAYTLVVKVFDEKAEKSAFDNEIKLYGHLSDLQGVYIPYVLASGVAIFDGTVRRIIVMSYGGVPLNKCVTDDAAAVAENLLKAFTALSEKNVCHDDIAFKNILVDEKGKVAVIDLESAGICPGAEALHGQISMAEKGCQAIKDSGKVVDFLPPQSCDDPFDG
jgi:tRNA A-37 threonylcarbamoyl transferase component Bud32